MMSPSDEKRIVAMVDSFTKTVARNFSRNLKRAKANAEKHYSDEPVDYLLETLSHDDRYPSDHFVLYADELSCVVHSETLYKALCSLPEKQRKVLLFDFWYAWADTCRRGLKFQEDSLPARQSNVSPRWPLPV